MLRAARTASLAIAVGSGCDPGEGVSDVPDACGASELYDEYVPGSEKVDERVRVTLVRARPAPPQKGTNEWEIAVSDLNGDPMEELGIAVFPFMPDHGHGTSTDPVVTTGEEPGEYSIDDIELVMGGRWEIRLEIDDGGADPDEVVFTFCVLD